MSVTSERREQTRRRLRWERENWREVRRERAIDYVAERIKPQPERQSASFRDNYLTITQLAEEFGIHRRTLDRWHRLRVGPPRIKVPGTKLVRYRRASVEEWLQKRESVTLR